MLLEELLDSMSVNDAFDNLATKVVLEAVIVIEIAGLGQFPERDQVVIESFTWCLSALPEILAFNSFIYSALDILLQGSNNLRLISFLGLCKAKIIHNGESLTGHAILEDVNFDDSIQSGKARESHVRVPLLFPCKEVRSPVHINIQLGEVPRTKRVGHGGKFPKGGWCVQWDSRNCLAVKMICVAQKGKFSKRS